MDNAVLPSAEVFDPTAGLVVSRCTVCGVVHFPPRRQCPECWSAVVTETAGADGVLETYTEVHRAPEGVTVPYHVGYAVLQNGVRVFVRLVGQTDKLRIGVPLEVGVGGSATAPYPVAHVGDGGS